MNMYALGIFWSIGRQSEEGYFLLRHKDKYFLETAKTDLQASSDIFSITQHGKIQYRLKVRDLDIFTLKRLGWHARNSEERPYPNILDHQDFIRAYMEIHSNLDIITLRGRQKPRLRIYGNKTFLESITNVLASQIGTSTKKVQKTTNIAETSGVLYYQSRTELEAIFSYLYRPPIENYHFEFYERFRNMLGRFRA